MSDIKKFEKLRKEYNNIFSKKETLLTELVEISTQIKLTLTEIRMDEKLVMRLQKQKQSGPLKEIHERKKENEKNLNILKRKKQKIHLKVIALNKKLNDLMVTEETFEF